MEPDFPWPATLRHRRGAPCNLEGIDVFYDFEWSRYFNSGQMQFRNGKCLARQVLCDCPADRTPVLLLTCLNEEQERSFLSDSFFVLVINFPRYLEQADADAAVSYLASRFGPGVTNLSQFSELAARSPDEVQSFLEQQLTAEQIAEWAAGSSQRISELARIAGDAGARSQPSPAEAIETLKALESLDSGLSRALSELLGRSADRNARLEAFKALTSSSEGRRDAGEVLGRRADARLQDARTAVVEYEKLLAIPQSNETTFQRFIEANLWLLGLDYVQMRPRHDIPRGSLDFILERFDGFHDVLELKSPQDPIIEAPDQSDRPPSASQYKLSPALSNALAQTHVYREVLTANPDLLERQFGLPQSRDPHVVIVIGRGEVLPSHRSAVLRELNKSLHRVEVVPYDVLGKRAGAILDSVEKYWGPPTEPIPIQARNSQAA